MGWVGEWVGWMNGALQLLELLLLLRRRQRQEAIPRVHCSCEDKTWAVSRVRVGGGLEGAGAPVQRHCPGPNPSHTQGRSQVPMAEMTLRNRCVGDCVWRLHACASHACPHPTRPWHGFIDLRVYTAHYMDARACTQGYLPPAARANMGAVAELSDLRNEAGWGGIGARTSAAHVGDSIRPRRSTISSPVKVKIKFMSSKGRGRPI